METIPQMSEQVSRLSHILINASIPAILNLDDQSS